MVRKKRIFRTFLATGWETEKGDDKALMEIYVDREFLETTIKSSLMAKISAAKIELMGKFIKNFFLFNNRVFNLIK